jgi:transposase
MTPTTPTRPCRRPIGSTLLGLCPSCRGETYLERVPDGWKCPDCDHVNEGRFRAPVRSRRTIDTRRGIALCEAGYSCHRAAKTLGCSPGMLKRAMQRAGFTPRLHKPTNPGRPTTRTVTVPDEILHLYPDLSVREIAARAGVSPATAYRRVRELRDGDLAPREVWQRRPHVLARRAVSDERCSEAIAMRDRGAKWLEIAVALGYADQYHAIGAVRRYRQRTEVAT